MPPSNATWLVNTMRRSTVLNGICDNNEQYGDEATLRSIHSYLESRLILLKSIQVNASGFRLLDW